MWDLSSLNRDLTYTPALEHEVLTTGPPGNSLWSLNFFFFKYVLSLYKNTQFPFSSSGLESQPIYNAKIKCCHLIGGKHSDLLSLTLKKSNSRDVIIVPKNS